MAGYVDFRQSLGTWLTLDAGLRVDRHSHVGTEWVPQAGVSFHLPRSAEIKLSAGKGFRYPTIRELYMFRPANPDLRPERGATNCRSRSGYGRDGSPTASISSISTAKT